MAKHELGAIRDATMGDGKVLIRYCCSIAAVLSRLVRTVALLQHKAHACTYHARHTHTRITRERRTHAHACKGKMWAPGTCFQYSQRLLALPPSLLWHDQLQHTAVLGDNDQALQALARVQLVSDTAPLGAKAKIIPADMADATPLCDITGGQAVAYYLWRLATSLVGTAKTEEVGSNRDSLYFMLLAGFPSLLRLLRLLCNRSLHNELVAWLAFCKIKTDNLPHDGCTMHGRSTATSTWT